MPLIEGFGDEVLVMLAVLLVTLLLSLAWMSTRVADSVPISVIILDRTSRIMQRVGSSVGPSAANEQHNNNGNTEGITNTASGILSPSTASVDDDSEVEQSNISSESLVIADSSANEPVLSADDTVAATQSAVALHDEQHTAAVRISSCLPTGASTTAVSHTAGCADTATSYVTTVSQVAGSVTTSSVTMAVSYVTTAASHTPVCTVSSAMNSTTTAANVTAAKEHPTRIDTQEQCVRKRSGASDQSSGTGASTQEQERVGGAGGLREDNLGGGSAREERVGDASEGSLMNICLQFVDGQRKTVQTSPDKTIGSFKRDHFSTQLDSDSLVRFVMNGQELRDDTLPLSSYNITEGSIIHCLITHRPVNHTQTMPLGGSYAQVGGVFDIGRLMWPLFGSVLALLWYARITYRGFFNAMSTFCLIAISFFFVIGLLASIRSANHGTTTAQANNSNSANRPHQD